MITCDFCERPATIVAYYGDERTIIGGGQGRHYVCDHCPSPLNFAPDPHASYTHEAQLYAAPGYEADPELERVRIADGECAHCGFRGFRGAAYAMLRTLGTGRIYCGLDCWADASTIAQEV